MADIRINRLRLIRGKIRRTKRDRWFSHLPVMVWPMSGTATLGVSVRVGEAIYYLAVVRRRKYD